MIKEIIDLQDMKSSIQIIIDSFKTVAEEFNLTRENCPTHPSFITFKNFMGYKDKGLKFFGLFENYKQIGFIAVEKANDTLYYIEKLSVLPEYRHKGYGKKLINFVFDFVKNAGGEKISIAIIDKSKILKDWYKSNGFIEINKKDFKQLPFTVCFLEKGLL
jgi:ribosomal protein S18 acetylase RimI-like enzyme